MGVQATFVIPWAQTEIDGIVAAGVDALCIGANWRAICAPTHVFGQSYTPDDLTDLEKMKAQKRAAVSIERLLGLQAQRVSRDDHLPKNSFVITDGRRLFDASLILADTGLLVMFVGSRPEPGRDYWLCALNVQTQAAQKAHTAGEGVICFAAGTHLRTPFGSKPIEAFKTGDLIQTKDNGVKSVIWAGQRDISGARLHVMPHLRPIRFMSGALGYGRPDQELIVSPQHRMLVKGAAARDIFGAEELLVSAKDLVDGKGISRATHLRSVVYHHLLLEQHQIVFANGLETESFHPAQADLDALSPNDQHNLLRLMPHIGKKPEFYGQAARRSLTDAEAAILAYRLQA